jgi:hypothetical protein
MDHERRISRSEAQVKNIQVDIGRLYNAIERLGDRTDKGFAESRKEFRWVVGLVLLNTPMVVGMAGRVFEVY